jgi:hypothetical protein
MVCHPRALPLHDAGPLRLETLWMDSTASPRQWATAVPDPSVSWKLFFQDVRKREGSEGGLDPCDTARQAKHGRRETP